MHSDFYYQRFEARFSDGKTAGSREVTVEHTERGLRISPLEGLDPLIWPYGAIATAEPLTDHAIDALVTYNHQPGATLFVPGPKFARSLARLAPHLTASAERWRSARPWLWGSAAVVGVVIAIWLSDLSPAHTIAAMLPDKVRSAMGVQAIQSMSDGRTVCNAAAGRAALEKLTGRLSAATRMDRQFKVVVIDWDLVNAFATPGENVVITRALLESAEGPDEVAGVLAHEMGHGTQLHPEAGVVRAMGLAAAAELLMGGTGGTLGNIGIMLVQLSYSRDAEREADALALEYLRNAEISPKGFAHFFERMSKSEGFGASGLGGILSTHPGTDQRLANALRSGGYQSTPALSEADWTALRSICSDPLATTRDE
jgi:predicted Zn-dependent protease